MCPTAASASVHYAETFTCGTLHHIAPAWRCRLLAPYLLGMGVFLLLLITRSPGERTDVPRGSTAISGVGRNALPIRILRARGPACHRSAAAGLIIGGMPAAPSGVLFVRRPPPPASTAPAINNGLHLFA